MLIRNRIRLIVLFLAAAVAFPVLAFEHPLSSSAIRDAFMLGKRNDFRTAEYFARYSHRFPMPETGPHVAVISIETPYGQVVELGETSLNGDTQRAEQELADKAFPFIVRVGVDMTDTYPGPPPWNPRAPGVPMPDFQRDFDIQLIQGKKIPWKATQVYLLYSDAVANIYQISGAIIELQYDTDKLDPYDDVTVKVHTPDDQNIETTFDLVHLR
ncbi:MAG: hypothetical protein ACRD5M_17375 [Candidatus Acidiferrales bacterium]